MVARKNKTPTGILVGIILFCLIAGVLFLTLKVFSTVPIRVTPTSPEAAKSCQAKFTKMLIDETLAFNYQKTRDITFSQLEINSWLQEKLRNEQVTTIRGTLQKNRIIFSGLFRPFAGKSFARSFPFSLLRNFEKITITFRIYTRPTLRSDRVYFDLERVILGKLHIPPGLIPNFLNALDLNPFKKEVRTIKDVRITNGSLIVTVYAD
ncbi:MAG: hypothetical protein GXP58_09085 [Deltaproteobacteria bacterium]|nr:hypothetical protein [Deltaproteobacteria bacterium]